MIDQTSRIETSAGTSPDRFARAALGGAAVLLVAAALLLWSQEGVGVFAQILLNGLGACL